MSVARRAGRQQSQMRRAFQRMLRVSAAAASLYPATLRAGDFVHALDDDGTTSFGAGVFVGYQFGPRPGLEWGLEAFATRRLSGTGCSSDARHGYGPLLQLAVLGGGTDPRLTLALQGGGELQRGLAAINGELGLSYRFGSAPGFGIHLGVRPELVFLNSGISYQLLRNELWVGGGVRFLPSYGQPGSCVVGRPLRTEEGLLLPAAMERPAGASSSELAGHAWLRDAALEAASVPAFLQLSAELLALGAPAPLVERALDAARDELAHAVLCARVASAHLGRSLLLSPPTAAPRALLRDSAGLERLAVESWLDGCITEGLAARQAARAATLTADPELSAIQQRIARDEHRHAELAWSILHWASARGGEPVRTALRALVALEPTRDEPEVPDGLERHGRLAAGALMQIAREHRERSLERLDASGMLSAPS